MLPEEVSPTLEKLMNRARKSSVEDERPENRFGLMAPISVASPVCVRHRFERNVLPLYVIRISSKKVPQSNCAARSTSMSAIWTG